MEHSSPQASKYWHMTSPSETLLNLCQDSVLSFEVGFINLNLFDQWVSFLEVCCHQTKKPQVYPVESPSLLRLKNVYLKAACSWDQFSLHLWDLSNCKYELNITIVCATIFFLTLPNFELILISRNINNFWKTIFSISSITWAQLEIFIPGVNVPFY